MVFLLEWFLNENQTERGPEGRQVGREPWKIDPSDNKVKCEGRDSHDGDDNDAFGQAGQAGQDDQDDGEDDDLDGQAAIVSRKSLRRRHLASWAAFCTTLSMMMTGGCWLKKDSEDTLQR